MKSTQTKSTRKKPARPLTRKELRTRLDRLCSIYVRYSNLALQGGNVGAVCVSCRQFKPLAQIHCGHFIGRGCQTLRFNLLNLAPECAGCNVYSVDHLAGYADYIVKKHGTDTLEWLVEKKRLWTTGEEKVSIGELRELYTERLAQTRSLLDTLQDKNLNITLPAIPKTW